MARHRNNARSEVSDLLGRRPGWRLEPRTTPGASPLWCFVDGGEVEFSVTAEGEGILLYVMETDEEVVLKDAQELTAWLQMHRADALQDVPPRQKGTARWKGILDWN